MATSRRRLAVRTLASGLLTLALTACGSVETGSIAPTAPVTGATQPPAPPANRAPQISGNPAGVVTVGQAYAFTPLASDPDGNSLAYSVAGKPAWLAFNTSTGALSGTPSAADAGVQSTITITVSDGSLQSSLMFALQVAANANRPPVISGNGTGALLVGQSYAFTPTASDPDGTRLTFSITGKPAWAQFDAGTGRLVGMPGASDVGTSNVVISVSDGVASASIGFTITVGTSVAPPPPVPTNRPPVISGNGAATVTTGGSYSFTPTASDPDGNALTFAISGRPAWASFNAANGSLGGTPGAANVGTSTVTIAVSDGSLSASVSFAITVVAANRAPTISGTGTRSLIVGQSYTFTPAASDPDGNPLTFSVAGKPAWLAFSTATGALTGAPAAGDVGVSNVTITVSDGTLSASLTATITVTAANRAPTISGTGTRALTVGQAYAFTPAASDPDNDALTFSITGKPAWLAFDASTGALTGTPAAGDVGVSNVTITVSDGTLSASLAATITVAAANRAPTISGTGTRTLTVGQAYAFTPVASDPDGNPLTFSVAGKPAWLAFSTATGALTGTPAAGDVGVSNVTITVSDGTLSASLAATITVTTGNRAPTISGSGTRTVTVGQPYSFTPTASDPDNDPLTFSITGKPAWLAFNANTGALTGTPAAGDVGVANVTITVSDGTLSASLAAAITVAAVTNGSATLSWTPPTTRADGTALTNLASYRIYYGTQSATLGSQVNLSNPGLTTYVLGNLAPGTWYFAITALDSTGAESDRSNVASLAIN